MRVHVCGVRGSTPSSGPDFVRYGGHTSCIAIAHDGEAPSLLVDAGTGIRRVSTLLDGRPFEGSVVLGHLHWDHTQGIPFFRSGDDPRSRVVMYAPAQGDTEAVLERFMSPPFFPVTPGQLRGSWSFEALEPGKARVEGFSVVALEVPHKGGRTFGYRISDGRSTVAYISDHCPTELGPGPDGLGEYHDAALELVHECDLLFHDAQYTDEELPEKAYFGHASSGYAVRLAETAGVRHVALFHHDPWRTDDQVDAIVEGYRGRAVEVMGASEESVFAI
ncbi:MAG: MBL fold metallo-hydrolase [Acidimicrobiales bacterium]